MSGTPMMIILAVGGLALIVFAGVFLFMMTRLRRIISSRVRDIENLVAAMRFPHEEDKPGGPPP